MDASDIPITVSDGILSPEDEAALWEDPEFEAFAEEMLNTAQRDCLLARRSRTPESVVLGETLALLLQETRTFGGDVPGDWHNLPVAGADLPSLG